MEFDGYNISDVMSSFETDVDRQRKQLILGLYANCRWNDLQHPGQQRAAGRHNRRYPVSGADAEETLDIVQAIGMAPGLSQVRVYIGSPQM